MSETLDSYWPLVEPMFDQVSIDDPAAFAESVQRVPRPSLLLFAAHFCLSEVWNGGLLQFFWNSTGLLAPEAIEGFGAIGMPKLAGVIATAAACLGDEYPRDREQRWDAMLVQSGLDQQQLTDIFDHSKNKFLAFKEATAQFEWDRLTEFVYDLAEQENGGFQTAATQFANQSHRE